MTLLMADYDGANAVSCLMILNVGWYNHQLFFYVDDVAEVDGMSDDCTLDCPVAFLKLNLLQAEF